MVEFLQKFWRVGPGGGRKFLHFAGQEKRPKSLIYLGLLDVRERWRTVEWWSRRELNPRPKAITGQFYMFSCLIWFLRPWRAAARSKNRQSRSLALGRVTRLKASR